MTTLAVRTPPNNKASTPAAPDYTAIKQRQQATWASGDFAVIGTTLQIVGESLAEAADIHAGERVLDVAAGNGNAPRRCPPLSDVTSTDFVSELLDKGRARAAAEGLQVDFRYRSAAHWMRIFREFYGPTHEAFAALDPAGRDALAKDITTLLNRCNTAGSASLVAPGEYLEVVIERK